MNLLVVKTARQAFDSGEKRYFTGVPCLHGHVSQRMVSNGMCVECLRERRTRDRVKNYATVMAWRKAHPEAVRLQQIRYSAKHPDKVRQKQDRYRYAHRDEILAKDREAKRRIRSTDPLSNKLRMARYVEKRELEKQRAAGRPRQLSCEICGCIGRTVFDHCHDSGRFRGWICDRCNKVLGLVRDSRLLLTRLGAYLRTNGVQDDSHIEYAAKEIAKLRVRVA